jgi:hypothetical protein
MGKGLSLMHETEEFRKFLWVAKAGQSGLYRGFVLEIDSLGK